MEWLYLIIPLIFCLGLCRLWCFVKIILQKEAHQLSKNKKNENKIKISKSSHYYDELDLIKHIFFQKIERNRLMKRFSFALQKLVSNTTILMQAGFSNALPHTHLFVYFFFFFFMMICLVRIRQKALSLHVGMGYGAVQGSKD